MSWGNRVSGALLALCYLYMGGLLLLQGRLEKAAGLLFMARGMMVLVGPIVAGTITSLQLALGAVLTLGSGLLLLLAAFMRAHKAVERKRVQYQSLLDDSLQGVLVIQQHTPCYANPSAARMFGFASTQQMLEQDAMLRCVPVALQEKLLTYHSALLKGQRVSGELRACFTRVDGTPLYLRVISSMTRWQGEPAEQLLLLDETKQIEAEQALQQLARFDQLTGLANKQYFVQALEGQVAGAIAGALVLFNINRFKHLNESWGDEYGDRLLQQVAERLKKAVSDAGLTCRLAADEFGVWLPSTQQLQGQIQALQNRLEAPYELDASKRYFIRIKMGVACFPEDETTRKDLMQAAAMALHDARASRNQSVHFHDPVRNTEALTRLKTELALREAIEQQAFDVFFQGKYTAQGELVGCEALARWQSEPLGWVSPAVFIPLAERTGMIAALGDIILNKVLQHLAEWQSAGLPVVPVAINISALQLAQPDFVHAFVTRLQGYGISPSRIELEITETAAIESLDTVKPVLDEIRRNGLALALDDFGTGQSSLKYLQDLPVTTLKIDRTFVAPLPDKSALPIVRMLCSLAKAQSLTLVAEGVETEQQARLLRMLGVDQLQGYLYAKPEAAEPFQRRLKGIADGSISQNG